MATLRPNRVSAVVTTSREERERNLKARELFVGKVVADIKLSGSIVEVTMETGEVLTLQSSSPIQELE